MNPTIYRSIKEVYLRENREVEAEEGGHTLDPVNDDVCRDIEADDRVQCLRVLLQKGVKNLGLGHGARKPIQQPVLHQKKK